ncbi:MAG TPA: hypothetical protein VLA23_06145 [Candidatus Limnocylindrales bacterium]|nr:hypothetical protein [Candidatus Limnocylindrales bacterium]
MAQQALESGATRKRVFFGLLDADGWSWAAVKAVFWLIVLIMLLGYIPDRAYYFTVFSAISIGLDPAQPPASAVTPINLCPPENGDLPCPAPTGSMIAWEPSPAEVALPSARTDGGIVQLGSLLVYVGGSDGAAAVADTSVARLVEGSSFDAWEPGPALPAPRSDAGVVAFGGVAYVIGGLDADGQPTTTVYRLTIDLDSGELGTWELVDDLALPEARAGAAVAVAPDGLILVGGRTADGPVTSVWKSDLENGKLGAWAANAELPEPRADHGAALVGDYLWVYGGTGADGAPTTTVLRGTVTVPEVPEGAVPGTPADPSFVNDWATNADANLPVARANPATFTANGIVYLVGGNDGSGPKGEVYWGVPDGDGDIAWTNLEATDLPDQGLEGAAGAVSGSTAFVIGGETSGGVLASSARASLAPGSPYLQIGLLGVTIPALGIQGEIGQQIGYLNAAGVGTVNFVLLILVGLAFAHPERAKGIGRRILRVFR